MVLSNRPPKYDPFFCILTRACACGSPKADRFRGKKDPLWIQPVEYVGKAFAFFTDEIFIRDR